jgi:hypothetical protein
MRATIPVLAIAAVHVAAGCAPQIAYQPAATSPAARPSPGRAISSAGGDVEVSVVGLKTIRVANGRNGQKTEALEVRLVAHNRAHDPWLIDANSQVINFPGWPSAEPLFALSEGAPSPQAVLLPGDTRTVELFFPVLPLHAGRAAVPGFHIDWRVDGPQGVVARRSVFFAPQVLPRRPHVAPPLNPVGVEATRATELDGLQRTDRGAADGGPRL